MAWVFLGGGKGPRWGWRETLAVAGVAVGFSVLVVWLLVVFTGL